jgi:hypothetical protein
MKQGRRWLVLPIASVSGAAVASFALWAGLQNNNQGEFYDTLTGRLAWDGIFPLWLSWFVPTFLVVAVICAITITFRASTRDR